MARQKDNDTVTLHDVEFKAKSAKAVLVDCGTGEDIWIPISQIVNQDDDSLEIPMWLAKEKGFY